MEPSVIKMMFNITDKQYTIGLINGRLCAMGAEQFQRKNGNDNEGLQYYLDKYNEIYAKAQSDFIHNIKAFGIEKEVNDIFRKSED